MSWQAAVILVLGLVLAVGFVWYERSRPSARLIALVAALAALAVAGRVALAPLPNVVATTDIALLTGFALGGAPGFAVGALAGLVSNFWLGHGPWTVWQMAAWGGVGLAGAGLAHMTGRQAGRWVLAGAAAAAGLAYGLVLDLSVMVSFGGEQSLDRYLALAARGVPFNVAHAAGNAAIALAVGPALVAMLVRYRTRSSFEWQRAGAAAVPLAAIALVMVPSLAGPSAADARSTRAAAAAWLERQQNPDGGFGADPSGPSSVAITGWAMLGLEAAGRNPRDVRAGGANPVKYMKRNAAAIRGPAAIERTILALVGAGVSPHSFAGRDLVAELKRERSRDGSWPGGVNPTAFGILAQRAAGRPASKLAKSARWLARAQNSDGGWGFTRDAPSDADSTGAAMQALAAAGRRSPLGDAMDYLRRTQGSGGGFLLAGGSSTNSQSTAWAIQGIVAAGGNPAKIRQGGKSPLDFLAARAAADGHIRYSAGSDQTSVWVTAQALTGLFRKPFPIAAVPRSKGSSRSGDGPRSGSGSGEDSGSSRGGSPAQRSRAIRPPRAGSGGGRSRRGGGVAGRGANMADKGSARRGRAAARARSGEGARATTRAAGGVAGIEATGSPGAIEGVEDPDSGLALAGLGALALVLLGGFLLYRRRLP